VKIPDANVLLSAIDESARHHGEAREWLETALSKDESVGFAWPVLLAVIRLTTNPAIFDPALTAEEALELVDGWLEQPSAVVVHPRERHAAILRELLLASGAAGNLTSDAHLAAIAIEHGATLASFDADFHRFAGLRFDFLG
jgi:toxin-antitoxin system PIN domain toxin